MLIHSMDTFEQMLMLLMLNIVTTYIYLRNSSKIHTLTEKIKLLEKQAEEDKEILKRTHDVNDSFHLLYHNLYNVHSALHARNNMRYLYVNKPRKNDIVRGYEEACQAYKNAKDEFTKFILQA